MLYLKKIILSKNCIVHCLFLLNKVFFLPILFDPGRCGIAKGVLILGALFEHVNFNTWELTL